MRVRLSAGRPTAADHQQHALDLEALGALDARVDPGIEPAEREGEEAAHHAAAGAEGWGEASPLAGSGVFGGRGTSAGHSASEAEGHWSESHWSALS